MWQLIVNLSVSVSLVRLSLSCSRRVWLDQPSMKVNSTWVEDSGWGAASISFTIETFEVLSWA